MFKILTLLLLTLTSSQAIANTYYTKIETFKNNDIIVLDSENNISTEKIILNNLSNNNFNGNTVFYSSNTQLFNEKLNDGWNYMEFSFNNALNVSAGAIVSVNGNTNTYSVGTLINYYGQNGAHYSNNDIVSLLVKLPEGYFWLAKNGNWGSEYGSDSRFNPSGFYEGNPNELFTLTVKSGDIVKFGSMVGNYKSTLIKIYNGSSSAPYNYVNQLNLN